MLKNSEVKKRYTPKTMNEIENSRDFLIEHLKAIYFNNNLDENFNSFEDFIQETIFKREPEAIKIVKEKVFNE